ncbi:peroxynitrite isomerase THAP4-like [Xyrauchen texanus]|uniref:peroxynitrite isomerase THAP4-like n=1 Tax=Xyrauchen texanus TaxID=154827 RepID=UPI0022425893|nr:peroxynitrite isomerase THAP4-like [Xyrauchen texanus]
MPAVCCAVGCHNNRRKNKDIRLYSIPKEPKRRLIWLAAIRRAHWTPTKHSVLCNEHFISGEKSENPMSPDFVPSVFAHTSAAQKQRNAYKLKRFEQTQALKRKRTHAVDESHTTVAINNSDTDLEKTDRCDEHSYATTVHSPQTFTPCTNTACQATVKALTDECTALRAEITRVKEKADRMFFESFKDSDKMVRQCILV